MKWSVRQFEGAIAIVAVVVLLYAAASLFALYTPSESALPGGDRRSGDVVVELTGSTDKKGIYFLPEKSTVADLLRIAAVDESSRFNSEDLGVILVKGMKVTAGFGTRLAIGGMDAKKRLLYDLPIDINRASFEELLLVPGIGEAWARRIIAQRQSQGGFRRIEDLMNIKGIKEKKLAALKKYLFVAGGTQR